MKKKKPIARYTREELGQGLTDWKRVDAMSEEEVEANAASDPDNPPWTDEDFANAELLMPVGEPKVPVYIRLDSDVVSWFKEGGPGYQGRINAVLSAYVRTRKNRYEP